ncbi:hypothetical protein C0992_004223 [Termitomyces sp. T32_za158]|nr:hypothetical protein C0992_004223 [Termitomyces sp. T32_za158]
MDSVFRDVELARETIEKLTQELKKDKKTVQILKEKAQKENEKLQAKRVAERNWEVRIDALKAELKLAQEASREKATNLEAAMKKITKLKSKLELRSQKNQRKLGEMKTLLDQRNQQLDDVKLSRDALEARIVHMESIVKTLQGNLPNGEDNGPVDTIYKLSDSPAFQVFWKNLGINAQANASRKKVLVPLCGNVDWTRCDLKAHLDRLYQPLEFTAAFIFLLQGLLRWGPDKINALAFAPRRLIKDGAWTDNDEFSSVDNNTIEVFFVESCAVCYAGMYKCYHAREYFPEGVCMPGDISSKSLSRLTVTSNGEGALESHAQFSDKYETGEYKADCAILQCMGFNEGLYEKWCKSIPKNVLKRKGVSGQGRNGLGVTKKKKI